jgi:hypothetical protein
MNTEKICDVVGNSIKNEIFKREFVRKDILRLLFWKNYHGGYVSPEQLKEIDDIADAYVERGPEDETYIDYDKDKALSLANEIRKQIGLPRLIKSEYGYLSEEKVKDIENEVT